ncbi:MAG: hypothetical protein JXC32_07305 [Anaerolineae bacterium]|nr:hypothetical protein [Anaerolineae bacterium]
MEILQEAIRVIVEPPGDLVYFLVTLFALQQALMSALSRTRGQAGFALARRWVWVTSGLLIGRVALIGIGLLSVGGLVAPSIALPPFERWLVLAGGLGVVWAGLLGHRPQRWQSTGLWIVLALSLFALGYDTVVHSADAGLPALPASASIWLQIAILLVLIVAMGLAVALHPLEWEWAFGVLLLWALGAVAQLLLPDPTTAVDGWLRLASLVALPMLSILVHRQVTASAAIQAEPAGLSSALPLVEVVQSISRARDLDSTLIVASSKLASLLGADICALALSEEGITDSVRVVAIHPPTAVQMDPPRLDLADYAGLRTAFEERSAVVATQQVDDPWLSALYNALGFEKPMPLATIPLRHQGKMLGLMLLGKSQRGHRWRAQDLEEPTLVAGLVSESITAARAFASRRPEGETPGASTDQTKVTEMLEQAKQQIRALNARIRTLMQEIKARDEEIIALNTTREPQTSSSRETELAVWQDEVRELIEERESLHRKIKELTEDRTILQTERARLGGQLVVLKEQLEQVEDHRERLEEEVTYLQSQGADVSTPQPAGEVQAQEIDQDRVGLVVVDEEGQITMADALARQMLRLPVGDVVGMPINGAYPDARWAQTVTDLLTHSPNGGPYRAHLSLPSETGMIEAEFAALRGRDGEVDGLAITLRSSESKSEQHEAIVSLASELRTPMTAITGYTDLLLGEQAGILTDMQQQFLERVRANVEQLSHLISDLNHVASPDARAIGLSPKPISLVQLIEEAIMGLAASFRERRLAVQLDLPEDLSLVNADRDSLYQIMLRLISNAVACSKEGDQVVISAREEAFAEAGKHLRISVTDTGGGIAPEDYPRVFRRLYRANQPLVEGMGETGVGMAVAKTLVEANGGRIWVESNRGVGSTFSFLLPVDV